MKKNDAFNALALTIFILGVVGLTAAIYFSNNVASNFGPAIVILPPDAAVVVPPTSKPPLPPADFSISSNSSGLIRVESAGYNDNGDLITEKVSIVFLPEGQQDKKVMAYLDAAAPFYPQFQLVDGSLYFIHHSGQLAKLNPITKKIVLFALPGIRVGVNEPYEDVNDLNDFLILGDQLFYLAGKNCQDYGGQCDLVLYEYNLRDSSSILLASHLKTRNIMGIYGSKMYIQYTTGDAGCFAQTIEAYDFSAKTMNEISGYGECVDDFGEMTDVTSPADKEKAKTIMQYTKSQMQYLDSIVVKNGKIADLQKNIGDRNAYPYSYIRYVVTAEDRD